MSEIELNVINAVLWCPNCGEQHIDEAKPNVCESCGVPKTYHDLGVVPEEYAHACDSFKAWLNPPHKSHRCNFCNHVWRPADGPTNGVLALSKQGERDGDPKPKYFATKKDFDDAVEYASVLAAANKDIARLREALLKVSGCMIVEKMQSCIARKALKKCRGCIAQQALSQISSPAGAGEEGKDAS